MKFLNNFPVSDQRFVLVSVRNLCDNCWNEICRNSSCVCFISKLMLTPVTNNKRRYGKSRDTSETFPVFVVGKILAEARLSSIFLISRHKIFLRVLIGACTLAKTCLLHAFWICTDVCTGDYFSCTKLIFLSACNVRHTARKYVSCRQEKYTSNQWLKKDKYANEWEECPLDLRHKWKGKDRKILVHILFWNNMASPQPVSSSKDFSRRSRDLKVSECCVNEGSLDRWVWRDGTRQVFPLEEPSRVSSCVGPTWTQQAQSSSRVEKRKFDNVREKTTQNVKFLQRISPWISPNTSQTCILPPCGTQENKRSWAPLQVWRHEPFVRMNKTYWTLFLKISVGQTWSCVGVSLFRIRNSRRLRLNPTGYDHKRFRWVFFRVRILQKCSTLIECKTFYWTQMTGSFMNVLWIINHHKNGLRTSVPAWFCVAAGQTSLPRLIAVAS